MSSVKRSFARALIEPAMRKDREQEIAELQRENERLQRERRQLLAQREEHTDLVRYVEDEISY